MQVTSTPRGRASALPRHRRDRTLQEVCHDLRQPAAAILALVAAAGAEEGLPVSVRRRLDQIAAEARQISTIVGQAAGEGMTFRPLQAAEIALAVARSIDAATGSSIVVRAEADVIVVGDASALRRALTNLLDNAVRAAGAGGQVLVTIGTDGDHVHLDVHDSGPGFGSGPVGIAGLGLGIVGWLAESHGGDLVMKESHLGGTLARLRLPAARTATPPGRRERP